AKVLWIKNTNDLAEVEASVAYWSETCHRFDLTQLTNPRSFQFDAEDNLWDFQAFGQINLIDAPDTLSQEVKSLSQGTAKLLMS
ncbi:MAG: hypothetical protein VKJ46_12355, partial [Leptolyngbyaceae bacterium]|nr:hypothetical protein [Leptolyngbyaceae bacterium]